jgi:hypothetical protein
MTLAPVLLFVFKRLNCLTRTVTALQRNHYASETDLIVFSDGARQGSDIFKVEQVRTFVHQITGFKSITVIESETNRGLARSVKEGVASVLREKVAVIVVEDDLETAPNFLAYMKRLCNFTRTLLLCSQFPASPFQLLLHQIIHTTCTV